MATRGNIIFVDHWFLEEENITKNDIIKNKTILNEAIKNSYKIYVHSDMYPSGALDDLQEFLTLDGAKHRAHDTSYLSAWFVGWKCLDMSRYTKRFEEREFDPSKDKNPSLENFKKSKDFFGIGLMREPTDWASYSYIILPKTPIENGCYQYNKNSFDILIYDGGEFNKYLGEINSEDTLQEIQNEDWWY